MDRPGSITEYWLRATIREPHAALPIAQPFDWSRAMKRRTSSAPATLAALIPLLLPACAPTTTGSGGPTNPDVDAIFADLEGRAPRRGGGGHLEW